MVKKKAKKVVKKPSRVKLVTMLDWQPMSTKPASVRPPYVVRYKVAKHIWRTHKRLGWAYRKMVKHRVVAKVYSYKLSSDRYPYGMTQATAQEWMPIPGLVYTANINTKVKAPVPDAETMSLTEALLRMVG